MITPPYKRVLLYGMEVMKMNIIPKRITEITIITNKKNTTIDRDDVRATVWFLASILYELDDLQHFSETVTPTDPLDIRKTAQILAKAQLELREYHNNR